MAYKRKRIYAPMKTWGFKKRRTGFRKKRRFGKKATTFSTKAGAATSLGFKTKKTSGRVYRSNLYKSTEQKQHYRSNGAISGSINSVATQNQLAIAVIGAMDNGVAAFWQPNGGLLVSDQIDSLPLFKGDIIVRGGIIGLKLFNESTTVPVQVKCYLIHNTHRPTYDRVPGAAVFGWDPTLVPDFYEDVGKVIFMKEFGLEPLAEMTIERRLRVMKIDQQAWSVDSQRLTWLVTVGDPQTVVSVTTRTCAYFNVSLSGDVSGSNV